MKAKLVLSIVALVVVPTAILSLAAAFSIRSREASLQKRLVATAEQSLNAVADSLDLSLALAHSDAARSMSALLNTGQPDGMLPSAARLRAAHELLGQIYVLDTQSGFVYPPSPTNVMSVADRPPEWEELSRLKSLYFEDKQYESAAREYQALLSEPGVSQVARAEAVLGAAQCYRQLGRFEFAAEVLRQVCGYTTGARAARRLMLDPDSALRDGKGRLYSLRALKALLDTYREAAARDTSGAERWLSLAAGTEIELLDRLVFLFDYIAPAQREVIRAALTALDGPDRSTSSLETIAQLQALLEERELNNRFDDDLRQSLLNAIKAAPLPLDHEGASWIESGGSIWSIAPLPGSDTRFVGIQVNSSRLQTYLAELTSRMGAEHGFTILLLESDATLDPNAVQYALASGRLRPPFESIEVRAFAANPGALDRRRLWSHLQVWGIGILALGVLLGVAQVLRLASTELARARARTDFMAGISHDLHTPLASIRMLAESLHLGRVTSEEKRQQFLATILRESGRVAHLVERVLYFVRLGENALTYQLRPVNIGSVVRAAIDDPDIELAISEDLPETMADADAVTQLVRNLVDNAIKYSSSGNSIAKPVTVRVASGQNGTIVLTVQDHGIGIPLDEQERIFGKFYRTRAARNLEASGIGLGLTLCRHIVQAHNGSISVDSKPGEGSTFCVTLPVLSSNTGTDD